jgi:hypothetical protein
VSAWKSPRDEAVRALTANGLNREFSPIAVNLVFQILKTPDADMLRTGVKELDSALVLARSRGDRQRLVETIFSAMLEAAR